MLAAMILRVNADLHQVVLAGKLQPAVAGAHPIGGGDGGPGFNLDVFAGVAHRHPVSWPETGGLLFLAHVVPPFRFDFTPGAPRGRHRVTAAAASYRCAVRWRAAVRV